MIILRPLAAVLVACALALPAVARDQFALLIANSDYQKPGWNDLATPQKDVDELQRVLTEQYGFQTKVLRDATRGDIIDEIENFKTIVDADDSLLIYYAGHGIERNDGGYWVGVDGSTTSRSGWLKYDVINELIDADAGMKARHVLVVADSCYSGTALRSTGEFEPNPQESRAQLLSRRYNRASRTVLTSGGVEPVIDSVGNSQHSLFAQELLRKLRGNTELLDGHGLFSRIEPEVYARALRVMGNDAQAPEYGPLLGTGHNGGDFIFIPAGMSLPDPDNTPPIPPDPDDLGLRGPTKIVHDTRGQGHFHVGDEEFRDTSKWAPLYGACYSFSFKYPSRIETLTLEYEVYGAEATYFEVRGELYPFEWMAPKAGQKRPNYWSDRRSKTVPVGITTTDDIWIQICAREVVDPDQPGDVDDFQIRNLVVTVN